MTATPADRVEPLGIVELAGWCASMRDESLRWFRVLGTWVDDPDPHLQRWFAEAGHRHAWHAELWQGRLPTIPPAVNVRAVPEHDQRDGSRVTGERRASDYRSALDSMLVELDRTADRIDAELDPSTRRTIGLVRADLVELLARASTA